MELGLEPGQAITCVYDFGACLTHTVLLEQATDLLEPVVAHR